MMNSYSTGYCVRLSELQLALFGDELASVLIFWENMVSLHWACFLEKYGGRKMGVMGVICVFGQMSETFGGKEENRRKYMCSVTSTFSLCIDLPVISQIKGVCCAPRKWPSSSQIPNVDHTTFGFIPSTAYWCGGKNRRLC